MDGGGKSQSLVSVPNILGLNPKPFYSAYDVKAYLLLIAIRPSDGDVNPNGPLSSFFKKSKQCRYLVFPSPFHASNSSPIDYITIQHLLWQLLIVKQDPLMWPAEEVRKLKIDLYFIPLHCIAELKCLSCIRFTSHHICLLIPQSNYAGSYMFDNVL